MEREKNFFLVSGEDKTDLSAQAIEIGLFADRVNLYQEDSFMTVHVLTPKKITKLKRYCQKHGLICEAMPKRKLLKNKNSKRT